MAWLLTFAGVFLELPISQLLYAPSQPPVSVAIQDNLGNYHFGVGMAQAVARRRGRLRSSSWSSSAPTGCSTPAGWRRIGAGARG